jgi:hypothetical protein
MESGSTGASAEQGGEGYEDARKRKEGKKHTISIDMMPSSTRGAA